MSDIRSDIYERIIGSRATTLAANSTTNNSLEGVNTNTLMNGAICYVKDIKAYFLLDKDATGSTIGVSLVKPTQGPGLWKLIVAAGTTSYYTTDVLLAAAGFGVTTGALTQSQWAAMPASTYSASAASDFFGLNLSTGVLTYTGPTKRFLARLTASIKSGTAAQAVDLAINITGDTLIGTTNDTATSSIEFVNTTTASEDACISCQRIIDLASTNTVQGILRNQTGTAALLIDRYHLVLTSVD